MVKFTSRTRMILLIAVLAAAIAVIIAALSAPYLTQAPVSDTPVIPPEKRLVVYTSHKQEVWWPVIKEFEERTGIYVEVVEGGTNELLENLSRSGNEAGCDVMFGGGAESLDYYSALFQPYRSSSAGHILRRYQPEHDIWTPFSALPVVLVYNPKLVPKGQLTSWKDLMDPRYRGLIAFADPSVSASSFTALATMISACGGVAVQDDVLRNFAINLDGHLMASSGDTLTGVSSGSYHAGITLEETAIKRIVAGDSLAIVYPEDGTSAVPDGTAILRDAPHPENAKLFVDYTVCEDVQQLLVKRFYRRSVRDDVEENDVLPDLSLIPMADYDIEDIGSRRSVIMTGFSFYFGGEEEQ